MADTSDRKSGPPLNKRKSTPAPKDAAMGAALRSIYEETVQEQVPDEFLDLLGKLD